MKNQKLRFCLSNLALSLLIFTSVYSSLLILESPIQNSSLQDSSVSLGVKTEVVLPYGQSVAEHFILQSYNTIRWNFHTNDSSVRITLYGMHNSTYHGHGGFLYLLANSSSHRGSWSPPGDDEWYFVFKNEDSDQKTVLFTYNMNPPGILAFEITTVLFSLILFVLLFILGFSNKRKNSLIAW